MVKANVLAVELSGVNGTIVYSLFHLTLLCMLKDQMRILPKFEKL